MDRIGTVKWFSDAKGYGFIAQADGPDVFVRYAEIRMEGYRTLKPGMQVRFDVEEGPQGMQAKGVSVVPGGAPLEQTS